MKINRRRSFVLFAMFLLLCPLSAQSNWYETVQIDPIRTVGHGRAFGFDGSLIEIDASKVNDFQQYYLVQLSSLLQGDTQNEQLRSYLEGQLLNDGLSQAGRQYWLIAWMATVAHSSDSRARMDLYSRNRFLGLTAGLEDGEREKLSTTTLSFLSSQGVPTDSGTNSGGAAYITECRDAGVPIPPDWGTSAWTDQGPLSVPNFLGGDTTVYTYDSVAPRGGCIALPRIYGDPSIITLLGVICLGQDTSKACFWDNAGVPVGDVVPISDFVGGADLAAGADVCSDCHAGENPWVVHPGTALEAWGNRMPNDWYEPLVHPSWPQNPGPTMLLEAIDSDPDGNGCLNCHSSGYAGRFPRVSTELPGYCVAVLGGATRETMPSAADPALNPPADPGDPGHGYRLHAEALQAACAAPPADGVLVPGGLEDDSSVLSRPIVVGPLYACAQAIEVRGAVLNAELRVYIDGALDAVAQNLNPDSEIISVSPLVVGQVVEVSQFVDGLESGTSDPAIVRDHEEDYPDGLPAPIIDPKLIHECGRVIAVRHVTGAQVTVLTNGANPKTYSTGSDWTNLPPAIRPFVLGDEYKAYQSVCSDVSPDSDPEFAVAEPSPMPTPEVSSPIYEGQELVDVSNLAHGARTDVNVSGVGVVGDFATAVSWRPNVNVASMLGGVPLAAGTAVSVQQELCVKGPESPVIQEVRGCSDIPAPLIQNPFAGQQTIIVLGSVPGARIAVYDEADQQIADGAGDLLATTRPLVAGELLRAVQIVGPCTSLQAYQVEVYATMMVLLPEPTGFGPLGAGLLLLAAIAVRRARLAAGGMGKA